MKKLCLQDCIAVIAEAPLIVHDNIQSTCLNKTFHYFSSNNIFSKTITVGTIKKRNIKSVKETGWPKLVWNNPYIFRENPYIWEKIRTFQKNKTILKKTRQNSIIHLLPFMFMFMCLNFISRNSHYNALKSL